MAKRTPRYEELQHTIEVAFVTARDIHKLDSAQSFAYAYEEVWPLLTSSNKLTQLLAYTALLAAARGRGISFAPTDPSGDDIREELGGVVRNTKEMMTPSILGSDYDAITKDLSVVCATYLRKV